MSQLTAEQALLFVNGVAVPTLNAEHTVTERVIAAIPCEKADYAPDAISRSAIDLAWHIVTAESRFIEAVISGRFDLQPWPRADGVRSGVDVNAWYAPRFAGNLERLAKLSGEQLTHTIDFRGIFQFPAFAYVNLAIQHSIHHRGQLSMYLRPMGLKVPSIYGESYDARLARERAVAGA